LRLAVVKSRANNSDRTVARKGRSQKTTRQLQGTGAARKRIGHAARFDVIPCSLCGGLIDLMAEDCRPMVEEAKTRFAAVPAQSGSKQTA